MTYTDRHIVETYSKLFEGLKESSKVELIENLSRSLKAKKKSVDTNFYNSFGAFVSDKSTEEIITEIKSNRKFRNREVDF